MLLRGHRDIVETAAFSPDGRRIVTASDDGTVRIREAATGHEVLVLNGHAGYVESAVFAPEGRRIVTASFDGTSRIWDARAPDLDVQIGWARAAQFEPLSRAEQFQLGLPFTSDVRQGFAGASKCDELAGAPYDPDRRAPGVMLGQIPVDLARAACSEGNDSQRRPRSFYELGRALIATGDYAAARGELEKALEGGYRSARVDLAMLLSQPAASMLDVPRALQLYQQAWNGGVKFAAFQLGHLYEVGLRAGAERAPAVLVAGKVQAWSWYIKAAQAGDPSALARLGEEEDAAASVAPEGAQRHSHLRRALGYYTAAAECAALEDWPEAASKSWRYRRASLARLLAREGMMREVAEVYDRIVSRPALPAEIGRRSTSLDAVVSQGTPSEITFWQRIVALVRVGH
jgi:tetratricopeptide (TPR) repeat protein